MKKGQYSVEKISLTPYFRQISFGDKNTFYRWKSKYAGMNGGRSPSIEAVGRRKSPAEAAGGRSEFRQSYAAGCLEKKSLKPVQKRLLVDHLASAYRVSIRRACPLVEINRSTFRYRSICKRDDTAIIVRMREIAETRIRYGSPRIHTLLRREGYVINHKRTERIYREQGFNLHRKRPKRRVSPSHRVAREPVSRIDEVWGMDFVSDALFTGQRIRALTIVDLYSRECLAISVGRKLTSTDVIATLEKIALKRGLPERIKTDNGSEFTSLQYDRWAYENGIITDYSRRGKPVDNAIIESFNGSFRDECLNTNWFLSLEDAAQKIEEWRQDYNGFRPHGSLNELTPEEFAIQAKA